MVEEEFVALADPAAAAAAVLVLKARRKADESSTVCAGERISWERNSRLATVAGCAEEEEEDEEEG